MKLEHYTNLNSKQTLFGLRILQSYEGLIMYEEVLNAYKKRIKWVCEIGTATGSLSLFLAAWAKNIEIPFLTFDTGETQNKLPFSKATENAIRCLSGKIVRDDCFSDTSYKLIQEQTSQDPGLLFCDGGNKAKEVATFAPMTVVGSIIIAHDWDVEFKSEHVDAVSQVDYLQPWHNRCIEGGHAAIMVRNSK